MADNDKNERKRLYLGVDIGGTKVQASLVEETGGILGRQRCATPRDGGHEDVLDAICRAMTDVAEKGGVEIKNLTAIGIAVPGVVDPDTARVVVTPNMNLSGVEIGAHLEGRFGVPIAVGNDCNLGALGEKWLGSARDADSVMAILVGTGIGGGFVQRGKLWRGARESASEIGHIVMQIGGPTCGCGNRGCLEALASRSAIERDIREAVAAGKPTVLTGLLDGDLSVIRSGMLRRALAAADETVTGIMRRATEVLGHACLTVRHLLDPDVIVLGGGVVEGNSRFMMPIVESIVASDQLPGARDGGRVLLSALGDDAVVVGAVALARQRVDRSPFKKRFSTKLKYREVTWGGFGQVSVGKRSYARDVFVTVAGKVKKRDKTLAKQLYGTSHTIGPAELKSVCKGGPAVLFVGAGAEGRLELNEEAREFLAKRSISHEVLPTPKAIEAYNGSDGRKAILIHVTC